MPGPRKATHDAIEMTFAVWKIPLSKFYILFDTFVSLQELKLFFLLCT